MAESVAARLMKLDREKLAVVPTKKFKAERLSEVAGEDIYVTLKAISGDQYASLSDRSLDKGKVSGERAYDTQALIVAYGCADPDLRDKELQAYYKAASPKELAKKLFPGGELSTMSNRISVLSGFLKAEDVGEEDDEEDNGTGLEYEDVKN